MKLIRLVTIVLLSGVCTNGSVFSQPPGYGPPPDSPSSYDHHRDYDNAPTPSVEVGFFYEELSPYGDWVLTRDYGWAWFPRDVRPYWRPYTEGRWVITEYGWTWVSYEPFGWATYHYGRWARDNRFGWLWIPGTMWGPAWVSWQYGGGYVGWAPLPPAANFELGFGFRLGGFDLHVGIRTDEYSFVQARSFLEPRLSGHLIPSARNVTIIHNTTNITNYTYVDNQVINRGVEVRHIEQATGRQVRPLRIAGAWEKTRTEVGTSEVRIYRPDKKKLESVHIIRRTNPMSRAEPSPVDRDKAPFEVRVAPRADRTSHTDTRQLEQQERREQQELLQYQEKEKQQIEKTYQQEIAKAQEQAERGRVEKRHQAEREALQQDQRNAAQQLEARQEVKRRAALAKPPSDENPQSKVKDLKQEKTDGKGKDGKGKDGKGKDGKGKDGKGKDGKGELPVGRVRP